MAKHLKYTHPHAAVQLYDELIAAIPALAPVPIPGSNPPTKRAVLKLSKSGLVVTLSVPDDADEAAIEAVVMAHVIRPVIPSPGRARLTAARPPAEIVQKIVDGTAMTASELQEVVRFLGLLALRDLRGDS